MTLGQLMKWWEEDELESRPDHVMSGQQGAWALGSESRSIVSNLEVTAMIRIFSKVQNKISVDRI